MNDDLDKHLADAMGAPVEPAAEPAAPSTSKRTLKGALVAEKAISEPVRESYEEMKMRAKIEVLTELLAEQKATGKAVKNDLARAQADAPHEEMVHFTVNLPVQATNIRLDGREYYHGHTYKIRASQLDTFRDIQAMAWRHDDQVRGLRAHANGYRTNDMQINENGQAMSRPIY